MPPACHAFLGVGWPKLSVVTPSVRAMGFVVFLLGLVLGAAAGAVVVWRLLLASRRAAISAAVARTAEEAAHERDLRAAQQQTLITQIEAMGVQGKAEVEADLAAAQAEIRGLDDALKQAQKQISEVLELHRRAGAERDERELERHKHETSQSQVLRTIAPVADQLKKMQVKVEQLETERVRQHSQLSEQILTAQRSMDASREAASNLASALTNNAVRGTWGETQLRSLVESAGLLAQVDFTTQASIEAESGARRPDMVINLPGGKQLAIDAKVPFNSYFESQRPDIDPAARMQLLQDHAKRVRSHVDALSAKGYWTGLSASPEFTIAFIPNDELLRVALETDPSLQEYGFAKGVILATPTNLWGLLKTVAFTWKQDVLTQDAKVLFDLGRELYGRVVKLSEHAEKLRRSLESTVKSYNAFAGTLESRVLVTARKLDRFDDSVLVVPARQVETAPRALTAGDFEALADTERPELLFDVVDADVVEDGISDAG